MRVPEMLTALIALGRLLSLTGRSLPPDSGDRPRGGPGGRGVAPGRSAGGHRSPGSGVAAAAGPHGPPDGGGPAGRGLAGGERAQSAPRPPMPVPGLYPPYAPRLLHSLPSCPGDSGLGPALIAPGVLTEPPACPWGRVPLTPPVLPPQVYSALQWIEFTMAMLRYKALLTPRPWHRIPLATTIFSGETKSFAPAVLLFQPLLCFLSIVGSSSIIAYAVFQNTVRSPEVRSEPPSPSSS